LGDTLSSNLIMTHNPLQQIVAEYYHERLEKEAGVVREAVAGVKGAIRGLVKPRAVGRNISHTGRNKYTSSLTGRDYKNPYKAVRGHMDKNTPLMFNRAKPASSSVTGAAKSGKTKTKSFSTALSERRKNAKLVSENTALKARAKRNKKIAIGTGVAGATVAAGALGYRSGRLEKSAAFPQSLRGIMGKIRKARKAGKGPAAGQPHGGYLKTK
jgi:hypothetical protein